ncbi:MAG TPA: response regulator [Candidatus Angelobacter sp.]|jgi:two-component system chemotaxis response regulator CheY
MRALVIDDSGAMRSILRQYMRELKYEVVEARDGREALERCEQTPDFDIALVDWNMPVMNGLEFVVALRSRKEYDSMKLMMVTTENDVAHIEAALSAGANEFVMKPFTYEVLEEKMALLNDSM